MELDRLTDEQKELWSRVDALWRISMTRETDPVYAALHPGYTGWVTGQPQPHDREAAVTSVGPSSPAVLNYKLRPLSIKVFDGLVGVVHYSYVAEMESSTNGLKTVAGRWSEVYLRKDGQWLMISVSGGPDGER